MKYTAAQIKNWDVDTETPSGGWIPARPLNPTSIITRCRHALGVLTGRYDVLDWEQPAAPSASVGATLSSPWTGKPRDYRDVDSDPEGVLCVEPGAPLKAATSAAGVEVDALAKDAARYRWLRDREIPEWLDLWHQNPDRIDDAIDAAMTGREGEG